MPYVPTVGEAEAMALAMVGGAIAVPAPADDATRAKAAAFDIISELLFPGGDINHEWDGGTIEAVADLVRPFVEARRG